VSITISSRNRLASVVLRHAKGVRDGDGRQAMRSISTNDPAQTLQSALEIAARRRAELADLKSRGSPGAGTEALCNGALRTVIRLSLEQGPTKGISRRQLDRVMTLLSQRRVFDVRP
jgi:hypothetical protein